MDCTKIEPIEYNGQRVASANMLRDFIAEKSGTTILAARNYIARAQKKLARGVDFFKACGYATKPSLDNPADVNLYTKDGVKKLSTRLSVLKDFAKEYFDTPIEEPAIAPLATPAEETPAITPTETTADVTALTPVEWSSQRVLTTEQLAQFYECDTGNIKVNFNANKEKFVEGKHYFKLEGDALKEFKNKVSETYLVGKNANILYLWTERGAARHAKMLKDSASFYRR